MQAYLVPQSGPRAGQRIPVNDAITLGRTATEGCVIEDSAASRKHVEITVRNGAYFWEDLKSTNGTFINDKPMIEGVLQNGDLIRIGTTSVRFELEPENGDSTDDFTRLFRQTILDAEGQVESSDDAQDKDDLLVAMCTVMNEIATTYEQCSLVDKILKTTMKAIDAQRGAVIFTGPGDTLRACPVCNNIHVIRDGVLARGLRGEITISSTVAQRVIRGGETVLFKDTGTDAELNKAESIMNMRVRSIICVPIRGKFGVIGILYIDSDRPDVRYTHEHLMLSTAVGNSAGLAIENARMHQAMLDKQRIEQEIEYAASIQEGFLVKTWPNDDPRFQVFGEMRPAKTVGGDFYDFIQPTPDSVGILIGDVSGKGVPAALTMAQLLAEFRLQATRQRSPEAVISALNASFVLKSQRGMFCTLAYMTIDLATGRVTSANAGHHPVIHLRKDGPLEIEAESGLPIGIVTEDRWPDHEFALQPGDSIALYTDGIIEARSVPTQSGGRATSRGQEYTVENLLGFLTHYYENEPKNTIASVLEDVRKFCEPAAPHDDCTIIMLRYLGT